MDHPHPDGFAVVEQTGGKGGGGKALGKIAAKVGKAMAKDQGGGPSPGPAAAAAAAPTAAADSDRMGIVECVEKCRELIVKVKTLVGDIIKGLPILKEAAIALIILVLLLLAVLLVLYLIYRLNPRIPLISHTEDIDAYMESYATDLADALKTIRDGDSAWLSQSGAFAGPTGAITAQLTSVLARPDKAADIVTYVEFRKPLLRYGWLDRSDLRNNAPQFVKDDGESLDTADFRENVLKPLEAISSALEDLSGALHNSGDLRVVVPGWDAGKVKVATAVHTARMMLDSDHMETMNRMYATRRSHMPMAIWTVYYLPMVENVYTVRIPSYWEKFPKQYVEALQDGIDWWGGVGISITQIPCKLAYADPAERMAKCAGSSSTGENFFGGAIGAAIGGAIGNSVDADGKPRRPDIEEGFGLAAIGDALSSIGNFFINIGQMASALGNLFTQFPNDPFGSIIGLFTIVLGIQFGLIFLLLYILLTVTGIFFVALFAWVTVYTMGAGLIYTWYLVLLTVMVAIPYFGLWLIDMPTGGLVVRMMRCEAKLDAWFAQPGYAEDNGFAHFLPFCMRPCPERYVPSVGGTCCSARKPYMPDYCPQQQVFRILRAGKLPSDRGPAAFIKYTPVPGFASMPYPQKRLAIIAAYKDKVEWYQTCYASLTGHDYLTRHVCDNVDLLGDAVDAEGVLAMSAVCHDCFCEYAAGDLKQDDRAGMTRIGFQGDAPSPAGSGGTVDPDNPNPQGNSSQCRRLKAAADAALKAGLLRGPGPGTDLLRRALLLAVLVICVLVAMYSLVHIN